LQTTYGGGRKRPGRSITWEQSEVIREKLNEPRIDFPKPTKRISFDTEYDPDGVLLTCGVSDGTSAASEEGTFNVVRDILRDSTYLVGHSVAGDLPYLVDVGALKEEWVTGTHVLDSLLLARMVDENRIKGSYELETLFQSIYDVAPWKQETKQYDWEKVGKRKKKSVDARRWPEEARKRRCSLDAWAALMVAEHFGKQLLSNWPLVRFSHRIANVLGRITLSGAVVDKTVFEKHEQELEQILQRDGDLIVRAALVTGMEKFSLTNDNDLREFLFNRLGQVVQGKTKKTKQPSVDQDSLLKLDHPIARQIVDYNKAQKLYSVNVKGLRVFLKAAGTCDGEPILWLPFHINPLGARTGRRSSSKPNSQNWTARIRGIIRSRFSGGKIGAFDYSKLEPRIIAWVASDDKLMRTFTTGNGYVDIARTLFKKDVPKTGIEYRATKAIVLGVHYNKQTDSMAEELWDGILNEKGELVQIRFSADYDSHWQSVDKLRNGYLDEYSGLRTYMYMKEKELLRTQASVSATGRIRHLPIPDGKDTLGYHHMLNQAINYPIQSLAADVTGSALIDVEAALLAEQGIGFCEYYQLLLEQRKKFLTNDPKYVIIDISQIINEVHDEVTMDLFPGRLKRDTEIVVETMRAVPSLRKLLPSFAVPLDVSPVIGNHWGEHE